MFSSADNSDQRPKRSVRHVFFIRHGESRWNRAQEDTSLYGMFCENDHGLTEIGRQQAEGLRRRLAVAARSVLDEGKRGVSNRWDREYLEKLLNPEVIYCSPFTRALETAAIGLKDVASTIGGLVVIKNAREQRNSLLSADSVGLVWGDDITRRLDDELAYLYQTAQGNSDADVKIPSAPKLDTRDVQEEWWSSCADSEEDILERHEHFFSKLCSHKAGSSIVVVGHSHFFRRFFKKNLGQKANLHHADIVASLQEHILPLCGIVGFKLESVHGGDTSGTSKHCEFDIVEVVPLLHTSLKPASSVSPATAGMQFTSCAWRPSCGGRYCTQTESFVN